ncbi:MAG: hypothetical protein K6L81_17355 [Agarilytica sp.]
MSELICEYFEDNEEIGFEVNWNGVAEFSVRNGRNYYNSEDLIESEKWFRNSIEIYGFLAKRSSSVTSRAALENSAVRNRIEILNRWGVEGREEDYSFVFSWFANIVKSFDYEKGKEFRESHKMIPKKLMREGRIVKNSISAMEGLDRKVIKSDDMAGLDKWVAVKKMLP